jgi:hypothetical protein
VHQPRPLPGGPAAPDRDRARPQPELLHLVPPLADGRAEVPAPPGRDGPGHAWQRAWAGWSLEATPLGLHWADLPRPWTLTRWHGYAIRISNETGERWRARPPRPATPQAALDRLVRRAENTNDYDERERLIDEVGVLVAEQIRRVTGRTPDLDDEDEDPDSEFAGVDNGFLAKIGG